MNRKYYSVNSWMIIKIIDEIQVLWIGDWGGIGEVIGDLGLGFGRNKKGFGYIIEKVT